MSARPGGGPSKLPERSRISQRQQPTCPVGQPAGSVQSRRPSTSSAVAAASRQRTSGTKTSYLPTSTKSYGYGYGGYAGRQQPQPAVAAKVVCPKQTCPRPADSKTSCPARPSTSKGSQGSLRPCSAPGGPPCSRLSQRPASRGSSSGRSRTSVEQTDGKLVKKVTSTVEKRLEQPPCRSRDGSTPPPTLVTTTTTVEEYFQPDQAGTSGAANQKNITEALAMVKEEDREVKEVMRYPPPSIKSAAPEDYPLQKNLEQLKIQHISIMGRESQAKIELPPPDVPTEEVQPETLAQIMFTEERGMKMDAPPDHLVAHLFPDRDDMVEVSSVTQGTMQDVVVPTAVPPALHSSVLKKDDIHRAMETVSQVEKPAGDIFSQSKGGGSAPPNSVAAKQKRSGKPVKLLTDTTPPWISIDLEKMQDIIGASPARKEITKLDALEETLVPSDTDPNSLEYYLAMEPPRHHSRVQLRGSQKPPWFPAYRTICL
ncbi:uncharacterized protein LOC108732690 isoform X2 [Agrilus planipennis]|uniref:Uncharacterized protein LOC108732690 isoform X2 n=1 Tax=Agrilus planipennis TaxID=224129 RepID=A0A7F5RA45_AGRPL|nr:uncharacterized protein LOC108732690 isoform X2 [Agrilus planipennis]